MKNDTFLTNILTLSAAGLFILITGLTLYFFRDSFSRYIRFFLPIPPLAVAAYIYVYNLFEHFKGSLPDNPMIVAKDVATGIAVASIFFTIFTILLVLSINLVRKSLI